MVSDIDMVCLEESIEFIANAKCVMTDQSLRNDDGKEILKAYKLLRKFRKRSAMPCLINPGWCQKQRFSTCCCSQSALKYEVADDLENRHHLLHVVPKYLIFENQSFVIKYT